MYKRKFRISAVLVAAFLFGNMSSQILSTGSILDLPVSGLLHTHDNMAAESTWSGVSVDFRIRKDTNWSSAGIALNINDSNDFGYVRVCRVSNRLFPASRDEACRRDWRGVVSSLSFPENTARYFAYFQQ